MQPQFSSLRYRDGERREMPSRGYRRANNSSRAFNLSIAPCQGVLSNGLLGFGILKMGHSFDNEREQSTAVHLHGPSHAIAQLGKRALDLPTLEFAQMTPNPERVIVHLG